VFFVCAQHLLVEGNIDDADSVFAIGDVGAAELAKALAIDQKLTSVWCMHIGTNSYGMMPLAQPSPDSCRLPYYRRSLISPGTRSAMRARWTCEGS